MVEPPWDGLTPAAWVGRVLRHVAAFAHASCIDVTASGASGDRSRPVGSRPHGGGNPTIPGDGLLLRHVPLLLPADRPDRLPPDSPAVPQYRAAAGEPHL